MAFSPWSVQNADEWARQQADRFRRQAEAALFRVQAQQQTDELPAVPDVPDYSRPYDPEYTSATEYTPPNLPAPPRPEPSFDATAGRLYGAEELPQRPPALIESRAGTAPTEAPWQEGWNRTPVNLPPPPVPKPDILGLQLPEQFYAAAQPGLSAEQRQAAVLRALTEPAMNLLARPGQALYSELSTRLGAQQRGREVTPEELSEARGRGWRGEVPASVQTLLTQTRTGIDPEEQQKYGIRPDIPETVAGVVGGLLDPANLALMPVGGPAANAALGALSAAQGATQVIGPDVPPGQRAIAGGLALAALAGAKGVGRVKRGAGIRQAALETAGEMAPGFSVKPVNAVGREIPLAEAIKPAEAAPAKRYFHGTASVFDRPEPARFDHDGLFGPGYYLTDSPEVAGSYATARAREANYWRGQLADLDAEIAKAPAGQSRMLELRRQRVEQQASEALSREGQPNVRAVNVPEGVQLLDVDAPAPPQLLARFNQLAEQGHLGGEPLPQTATGSDLYQALRRGIGNKTEVNDWLNANGYDGLRYAGGKRMPIRDAAGQPVEHNAVIIFPESLPRITNAISGTTMGALLGPAVAAVPQQEGESDDAYKARLAAAGVLTAAGGLAMGQLLGSRRLTPRQIKGARAYATSQEAISAIERLAPKYDAATTRAEKLGQRIDELRLGARQIEQATGLVRPSRYFAGWTDADVEELARRTGRNPYQEDWFDKLDPVEVADFRTTFKGGSKAAKAASMRAEATPLQKEFRAAQQEMSDLEHRLDIALEASALSDFERGHLLARYLPRKEKAIAHLGELPGSLLRSSEAERPQLPKPETGIPPRVIEPFRPGEVSQPGLLLEAPRPPEAAITLPEAASKPANAAPTLPPAPPPLPPELAAKQRGPRVTRPEGEIPTPEPRPAEAPPQPAVETRPAEAPTPVTPRVEAPAPPAPPEHPLTVPAAQPPAPGRRLAGFLPTTSIETAIERKAKGILGKRTREPEGQAPRQPTPSATPQAGQLSLEPVAAGLKKATAAVDPWLVATNHVERIPLIQRSLESTGQQIVRQALAVGEEAWGKVKGVGIKDNRFAKGVAPNAANPGASLAVGDVLEYPDRYDMPATLRRFIRESNALHDDLMTQAKAEGVKIRERTYAPGGHYWMRVVEEVRGIEKRLAQNPGMSRAYDTMEAGIQKGVRYQDDPMALLEAELAYISRKIIAKRMGDLVQPLGRTPSQLIDKVLTDNAVAAAKELRTLTNGQRTVRAIRDGMSTTYTMNGRQIRRPQIGQMDTALPGTAVAIQNADALTGTARRAEFQAILDNLETARKQASKDFKAAKGKRAEAMRGLQSAEWAEGAKFGLPPGEIGLGRIEAPFAQGRLFPRQTADYLNKQFTRETSDLLRNLNSVSAVGRLFTTNFDLGTGFIQLLPVMASHLDVWAKAVGHMFMALPTPAVYRNYMAQPATQDVLSKLIPHGLTIEAPEYGEALQRGMALEKILPKAVSTRTRLLFEAPLNVAKIEMAKALLPVAERRGELRELAGFLNNATGTQSLLAQGIGAQQRLGEGALLFFSPRYTRSSLALVSQALTGGVGGAEARKALGSVAAAGILVPMAIQTAQGKELPEGFFDPTSAWFLSANVFGRRVGMGTIFRQLAVLTGNSLKAAKEDPSKFYSLERDDNPLIRFVSGRTAPATSLLWDTATGKDFLGDPLTTPEAVARRVGKSVVPMWAQEFVPEPGQPAQRPESAIPDILGMRAVPLSTAQRRDQQIAEATGEKKDWGDLDIVDRWELQQQHPEIKALVEQGAEERARRGDIVGQFWQAVDKMREPYFEQIKALTEQARQNKISGRQYRDEVRRLEGLIAEAPDMLKRDPHYASVPMTDEEKAAYYKGRTAPQQSPTDKFLDEYYGLAAKFTDPQTKMVDVGQLVQAQEALKAKSDPAIVERATRYVNRNRDPEYVKALEAYREYNAIPRYLGIDRAQERLMTEAYNAALQYEKQLPPGIKNPKTLAQNMALGNRPELAEGFALLRYASQHPNPERKQFWYEHRDLLERFFGAGLPEQGAMAEAEAAA